MKLYGIVKKEYIIDEGSYWSQPDTIEIYDSESQRDGRLLNLNGGRKIDESNSGMDDFYEAFDIELGAHSRYNEPIKRERRNASEAELLTIEQRLLMIASYMNSAQ